MNYWLIIGAPDKWFCDKCIDNASVNDALKELDIQSWDVRKDYFKDAQIGDKCIIKIGNDTRSIERRTLANNQVVDVLEAGVYALATIEKALYIDENHNVKIIIKVTKNLFRDSKIIDRDMSEKILGSDYLSMASKRIEREKYDNILSLISIEENSDNSDLEIDNDSTENRIYPAEVKIQRDMYSVRELKMDYEDKNLILAPDFQREFVWNLKQKSELVESILMGIPLPMVYFFEGDNGVIQVVDGKQRLTSLFEFIDNKYPLSQTLSILPHLRGFRYKELEPAQRTKIARYQFVTQTIIPPTPDRIKFDIFERVNRKGSTLNNQEMRNALYQGKSTQLLNSLSKNIYFLKATDNGVSPTRMKDKYMILRFLAFYLWKERVLKDKDGELIEYRSDMDEFVGKAMSFLNSIDEPFLKELSMIFNDAMSLAFFIGKENIFRIPSEERKRPINMALMESLGYLFSQIKNTKNPENYRDKIDSLLEDESYIKSLTQRVDSISSVETRFHKVDEVLKR